MPISGMRRDGASRNRALSRRVPRALCRVRAALARRAAAPPRSTASPSWAFRRGARRPGASPICARCQARAFPPAHASGAGARRARAWRSPAMPPHRPRRWPLRARSFGHRHAAARRLARLDRARRSPSGQTLPQRALAEDDARAPAFRRPQRRVLRRRLRAGARRRASRSTARSRSSISAGAGEPRSLHLRSAVLLGAGSRATLVESFRRRWRILDQRRDGDPSRRRRRARPCPHPGRGRRGDPFRAHSRRARPQGALRRIRSDARRAPVAPGHSRALRRRRRRMPARRRLSVCAASRRRRLPPSSITRRLAAPRASCSRAWSTTARMACSSAASSSGPTRRRPTRSSSTATCC